MPFRIWNLSNKRNNSIFRADNFSGLSSKIPLKHQVYNYDQVTAGYKDYFYLCQNRYWRNRYVINLFPRLLGSIMLNDCINLETSWLLCATKRCFSKAPNGHVASNNQLDSLNFLKTLPLPKSAVIQILFHFGQKCIWIGLARSEKMTNCSNILRTRIPSGLIPLLQPLVHAWHHPRVRVSSFFSFLCVLNSLSL